MPLKLGERLDGLAGPGEHAEDVETDGLGEGSALADDDLVTGLDTESGGDVRGEVLVALLVTGVLGDEVEVLAADDESACVVSAYLPSHAHPNDEFHICESCRRKRLRTVHLRGHDLSGQDTAADRDHTRERALLVDVGALNGGLGRAEAQTNILVPSLGPGVLARASGLVVVEDVRLSGRISIAVYCRGGWGGAVPASGKRAPTGHCALNQYGPFDCEQFVATYVSSVAMVADVLSVDRVVEVELSWAARSLRRRSVRRKVGRIYGKTVRPR
jgi:hypothetical protein